MTDKRIIDLQEQTEVTADAYVMTDNAAVGTKKFNLKGLYDSVADAVTGADAAKTAAQAAANTATAKAELADQKATLANEKATLADQKATLANTKASLADEKATLANAKATLANDAATNANAKAQAADEAAQAADAAREAIQDDLAAKADADGYHPLLGAGVSESLLATDETVDTFAQRVSDHDGACRITSLRGNTVRWNQLCRNNGATNTTGLTRIYNSDGSVTINGTATQNGSIYLTTTTIPIKAGDKFLVKGCPSGGSASTYYLGMGGGQDDFGNGGMVTIITSVAQTNLQLVVKEGVTFDNVTIWPQVFNLTQAFGAGNEPATVAEFERMYPKSYYPYDAGSLLSVNIDGVKSIGFNQWDEEWELGSYDTTTGEPHTSTTQIRTRNYVPVLPSTQYYAFTAGFNIRVLFYDASGSFISTAPTSTNNDIFTTPNNCTQVRFHCASGYGTVYNHDICINISDPSRNGTYEPYCGIVREIPPSTLFPDGILRSVESAYDERTPTKDVKRVGVVDLGTLDWAYSARDGGINLFYSTTTLNAVLPATASNVPDIKIAQYTPMSYSNAFSGTITDKAITLVFAASSSAGKIYINDSGYSSAASFKEAMNGVMLYYILTTPTEASIDPPLNLAYPVERGGTELIVIPEGEQSATPTMAVVYAYNADGVRDISQAIIAAIEGATASTNYAIGGYFVHGGKLYKATSAIATGETINPGTNCIQTTVMAELVALTA